MPKNSIVYTDPTTGKIDSNTYGVQDISSIVVGPTANSPLYRTDGTADQVQVNAAINALNALGGGKVVLQRGVYNISDKIIMQSNISLEGQGTSTLINIPTLCSIFIEGKTKVGITQIQINALTQNPIISDFGIYCGNSTDVNFEYIYGEYTAFGIFIAAGSLDTQKIRINNSSFFGTAHNDLIGGGPLTTGSVSTLDIIAHDNFLVHDTTQPGSGSYVNVMDIVAVKYISFKGNHVMGNIVFGGEQNPNKCSQISNNIVRPSIGGNYDATISIISTVPSAFSIDSISITNNTIDGGYINIAGQGAKKAKNITITGNTIKAGANVARCVELGDVEGVTITGNTFSNFSDSGIRFADTSYATITGNTFKDGTGFGLKDISIPQSSEIVVSGNYFNNVGTITSLSPNVLITGNKSSNSIIKNVNNVFATALVDNIRVSKSNNSTTGFLQGGGTSPNQQFNILPDHVKQVGATSVDVNTGFNAEISNFKWFSKWSGTNTQLLGLDGVNSVNTSFVPFKVDVINENTSGNGVTVAGINLKTDLNTSGIVALTGNQTIAGIKTFTSSPQISGLRVLGTDSLYIGYLSSSNTAPNQDFNVLPDYVKQVGAAAVNLQSGFNAEISNFRWYSKWSGTNTLLLAVDAINNRITANNSDVRIATIGKGLQVATGANSKIGTATLVAGTVTVSNTAVTANSQIQLTVSTPGGTQGFLSYTKTAGASFTITSTSAIETSVVEWQITEKI